MRRFLILAAILLGTCCGCEMFEECAYGPDPAGYRVCTATRPDVMAAGTCNAPAPITTVSQTQEPPR